MKNSTTRIEQARVALKDAEYILARGGAGLSDAASLKYSGSRFTDNFSLFIEKEERWYKAQTQYKIFLNYRAKKKTVYLELGAGFNTPGIIHYPFEHFTYHNINARLIRINRDDPAGENANTERTITFTEDMGQTILALLQEKELP